MNRVIKLSRLKIRFAYILLALVLCISGSSQTVYGLTAEQRRVIDSGVRYFDVDETTFCSGSEGQPSISGEGNIGTIFNYLVGKGLTDFQAAGVLGNMWAESGYQPQRLQNTPGGTVTPASEVPPNTSLGWGLVQWTPARKMINPVTASGQDPNLINVQLDFLWQQLEGGTSSPEKAAGDHLKATSNVADATVSFETKYERHAGPPQPSRIVEAERVLEMSRSGAIDPASNVGADSLCGTAGGGSAVATALEYAWPDYRGKGFTEKKPEYDHAVNQAVSEGKYVGGLNMPGVDCGGFVTLVMVNSGFEPGYNYNGRGGPTTEQERWTKENWQTIGPVSSTAELQPGDVAFTPGHTFMFVGEQVGFETDIASASLQDRAPMAGRESVFTDHNGVPVQWYRKR